MSRTIIFLRSAIILLVGSGIAYYFVSARGTHEFQLGDDLQHAIEVLSRVRAAEDRCHATTGNFAPLRELGPGGCGGDTGTIYSGTDDGFTVRVHVLPGHYSAAVHPIGKARLHSLYLDEAGNIHFGTRDWPATADSPLLGARTQ